MRNLLLIVAASSLLVGCDVLKSPQDKLHEAGRCTWCEAKKEDPGRHVCPNCRVDRCIKVKLDHMSDADHTASWSAELFRAIAEECRKLYGFESREKSDWTISGGSSFEIPHLMTNDGGSR